MLLYYMCKYIYINTITADLSPDEGGNCGKHFPTHTIHQHTNYILFTYIRWCSLHLAKLRPARWDTSHDRNTSRPSAPRPFAARTGLGTHLAHIYIYIYIQHRCWETRTLYICNITIDLHISTIYIYPFGWGAAPEIYLYVHRMKRNRNHNFFAHLRPLRCVMCVFAYMKIIWRFYQHNNRAMLHRMRAAGGENQLESLGTFCADCTADGLLSDWRLTANCCSLGGCSNAELQS